MKSKKTLTQILFWSLLLIYYLSTSWIFEENKSFLFQRVLGKTLLQASYAYVVIYLLNPRFLKPKKWLLYGLTNLILIYGFYVVFAAFRCFYLLEQFPEVYRMRPPLIFQQRIADTTAFIANIPGFVFPVIILMLMDYFKKQQEFSLLKEKQKSTELDALKNQLNPHFLFNTLNNIYALALKKSDQTPEAIATLSEILDQLLYRSQTNTISVENEIQLIENYIHLEKIRYDGRVDISLEKNLNSPFQVPPLSLLTFVENAFKHGVSQELNRADIQILINTEENHLNFQIENSFPQGTAPSIKDQGIGIKNITKQLDILFEDQYTLELQKKKNRFKVQLKIKSNEI
ncbi:MAG: sensor histidine kinase [Flavobacteriaceae bacterium]